MQDGLMTGDWERLAGFAARRRAELGLTQQEVAQRGPLSLDRVQAIEGAKRSSYRLGTLLALERALDWVTGSVESILGGGEPDLVHHVSDGDGATATDEVQKFFRSDDAKIGGFLDTAFLRTMRTEVRDTSGVDFGLGDVPPYPEPRDETELEANETWLAAKNLERVMQRQQERRRRRDIDEAG